MSTTNLETNQDNNVSKDSVLSWSTEEKQEKEANSKLLLSQCFEDSPNFRNQIKFYEDSTDKIQNTLRNIIKYSNQSIGYARDCSNCFIKISNELMNFEKLNENSQSEDLLSSAFARFGEALSEIEKSRQVMITHMNDVFVQPLKQFMTDELDTYKQLRNDYSSAGETYQTNLAKFLSKKIKDENGIQECSKDVTLAREDFHAKSLKYCAHLNNLQANKKYDIIEELISLMYSQFAFYHQGYELLTDCEPYMRELSGKLRDIRTDQDKLENISPDFEQYIEKARPFYNPLTVRHSSKPLTVPVKSGYLMKQSSKLKRVTWERRYFELKGDQFRFYSKKNKWNTIDLRLCMVREMQNSDRRNCFEIVSPIRIFHLQSDNEYEMFEWITTIQSAIGRALHSERATPEEIEAAALASSAATSAMFGIKPSEQELKRQKEERIARKKEKEEQLIQKIRSMPGNGMCADCGKINPEWASCNLGITLCITCSGIHRGLGCHISKVRSLTLDRWSPELITIMLSLGNTRINSIYEALLQRDCDDECRPTPESDQIIKEHWITSKYVRKEYIWSGQNQEEFILNSIHEQLFKSINEGDFPEAIRYIALGADIEYKDPRTGRNALHQAIINKNDVAATFVMQWLDNLDEVDNIGRTALHYAVENNNANLVQMLLKRHVKIDNKDIDDIAPIDIAEENRNSTIVTMLRLITFERENNGDSRMNDFGFSEAFDQLVNLSDNEDNNKTLNPLTITTSINPKDNSEEIKIHDDTDDNNSESKTTTKRRSLSSSYNPTPISMASDVYEDPILTQSVMDTVIDRSPINEIANTKPFSIADTLQSIPENENSKVIGNEYSSSSMNPSLMATTVTPSQINEERNAITNILNPSYPLTSSTADINRDAFSTRDSLHGLNNMSSMLDDMSSLLDNIEIEKRNRHNSLTKNDDDDLMNNPFSSPWA